MTPLSCSKHFSGLFPTYKKIFGFSKLNISYAAPSEGPQAPAERSNYPESGLVKQPRRCKRALSPSLSPAGVLFRRKGAAPLSGAEEQAARAISAHAQCACLPPLQMGSKS